MKNYNFGNQPGAQESITAALVANAASAPVATFDVHSNKVLSVTALVSVAALTALTAFGRTDTNAAWIPIPRSEMLGYGRSDSSTDIGSTPANAAAMVALDCSLWSQVKLEATSAGAASLFITAGVE